MHNQKLKKLLEINIGLILCGIAIAFFFEPKEFITGGTSGLAILLELLIPSISDAIFYYIINVALLLVSLFLLGKEYFLKTLYASIMLPTLVLCFELIIKACGIRDTLASLETWVVVAFGAVLIGVGVGLNLRADGGTGGVDVLQSIAFKYMKVPYSVSNYVVNFLIIVSGFFAGVSLELILAGIIFTFVNGYVIDSITFGGFNRRAVFIQSKKAELIKEMIISDLVRGCTSIDMHGGYSKEPGELIVCVCLAREYLQLRNKINEIDEEAFIFVTRATEVRGLGFTVHPIERINAIKNRKAKKKNDE